MKILLVSHSPLVTGGAEKCLIEYADVLTKAGNECRVVVPKRGGMSKELTRLGISWSVVQYIWATKPKQNQLSYITKAAGMSISGIFKVAESFNPDLIVTNTVVVPWGIYVGKSLNIPTALLVHETLSNNKVVLAMEPDYESYVQNLNDNVDYVIYNSEYTKADYDGMFTKPVVSKNLLYPVPNIEPYMDKLYEPNKINGPVEIVILGSMHARKNQLEALGAAKQLVEGGVVDFHIDLYGDGDVGYIESLRKYIKANKLDKNVSIKGYIDDVYGVLNRYNVVLSTFLYESFGRAALEGQLFGKVVIANDTGAGPELVKDGQNGLIYHSGDVSGLASKIEWIIKNKTTAEGMGELARVRQRKKYMSNSRYAALHDLVDYYKKNSTQATQDRFNPVYSLSIYASDLQHKYRHLYELTHNEFTRTILHHSRIAVKKLKGKLKK